MAKLVYSDELLVSNKYEKFTYKADYVRVIHCIYSGTNGVGMFSVDIKAGGHGVIPVGGQIIHFTYGSDGMVNYGSCSNTAGYVSLEFYNQ